MSYLIMPSVSLVERHSRLHSDALHMWTNANLGVPMFIVQTNVAHEGEIRSTVCMPCMRWFSASVLTYSQMGCIGDPRCPKNLWARKARMDTERVIQHLSRWICCFAHRCIPPYINKEVNPSNTSLDLTNRLSNQRRICRTSLQPRSIHNVFILFSSYPVLFLLQQPTVSFHFYHNKGFFFSFSRTIVGMTVSMYADLLTANLSATVIYMHTSKYI